MEPCFAARMRRRATYSAIEERVLPSRVIVDILSHLQASVYTLPCQPLWVTIAG